MQFTPALGEPTPTGPGTEVTLDPHGRVTAVAARGGEVLAGGTVLQGTGTGAAWLAAHAPVGARLQVTTLVRHGSTDGSPDSAGAVEAMNLDGGGSTAMAIRGRLVSSPSDSTGERPVGDVLELSAPRP